MYLLASLPESFSTLVTALESNATVPDMDIVIERLTHEERKRLPSEPGDGAALIGKRRPLSRGPKCFACQKFGHIQKNCPERMHKPDSSKSKKRNQVHQTQADQGDVGLVTALSALGSNQDEWIIDSGATCHICSNRNLFTDIHSLERPQDITLGDGHTLPAAEVGNVAVTLVYDDGGTRGCQLHDVLYVPKLSYNLLSVTKATEAGKKVKFYSNSCQILDRDNKVVAVGTRRGKLYYLNCQKESHDQVHVSDAPLSESKEFVWHRRLGHLNEGSLNTMASKHLVYDFDYHTSKPMPFCKSCVEGKLHRTPFKRGRRRAEKPLELIHSDVCGPIGTPSLSGKKYFVTFTDDKTHYSWIYFLKAKSEVYSKFVEWKASVERTSDCQVKIYT